MIYRVKPLLSKVTAGLMAAGVSRVMCTVVFAGLAGCAALGPNYGDAPEQTPVLEQASQGGAGRPLLEESCAAVSDEFRGSPVLFKARASATQASADYVVGFRQHLKLAPVDGVSPARCFRVPGSVSLMAVGNDALFVQRGDLTLSVYSLPSSFPSNSSADLSVLQQIAGTTRIVSRARALASLGDSVLVGGVDGIIYRWWFRGPQRIAADGRSKQIERYVGHAAAIEALAWHPNGNTFFSGDAAGLVNAWQVFEQDAFGGALDLSRSDGDLFTAKAVRSQLPRAQPAAPIAQLVVNVNRSFLALTTMDGVFELWRIAGLTLLDRVDPADPVDRALVDGFGSPRSSALSQDGTALASVDRSGRLMRFRIKPSLDPWGVRDSFQLMLESNANSSAALLAAASNDDGLGTAKILAVDRLGRIVTGEIQ